MIILHTSDWHIGQYFYGYDRGHEHLAFFRWLKETINRHRVDALLVAGDVFDSPNPSAESQRLYYRFLREVTTENPELQIIITAGNHDSAARLEAPNALLEEMRVDVRGIVPRNENNETLYNHLFVPLTKGDKTEAWCMAVPYLRQGDYPNAESYAQGVKNMYTILHAALTDVKEAGQPIIVMGHLQATGSELSDNDRSERTTVGGLDCVSPEVFGLDDILYTALGHLHKAQRVSGKENIRYSGSPLPMSFAEINYKQGVNLIAWEGSEPAQITRIEFQPPVKLLSLPATPKPLSEVLEEITTLPDGEATPTSPYLELKVLITEPEPSMRSQIEDALKHKAVRLTSAVPYRMKTDARTQTFSYEELKTISPMQMAEDVYADRYGNPMPEKMKTLLQNVIEESMQ